MKEPLRLTYAVLASTLLAMPAHADITVTAPTTNGNTATNVVGNVTVATTGQLWMNAAAPNSGAAILVNSANATVTLNSNNTVNVNCALGTALCTTGAGGPGINIDGGAGATGTIVTVGAGTSINAAMDGILVDGPLTSIQNSGNISSNNVGSAIEVTANGVNTGIYNYTGATLQGAGAPTILVNGQGTTISNTGTITATGADDAIQLNQSFTTVTSTTGGVINVVNGSAIDITGGAPLSGDVYNTGTINVTGNGEGVFVQNAFTGNIVNDTGGVINLSAAGGTGILANAAFTSISNVGSITAVAGATPINIAMNISGAVSNSGTLQSVDTPNINLAGNVTSVTNSGTMIVTGAAPAILAGAGVNVTGGITNTGTITTAGATAVDLSAGNNIAFTQSGGTITGDVLLAGAGGNIFNMTGGTITGDVTAVAASVAPNILTLSGGTITGTLQLGDMGDTVNLSGTEVDTITGGAGDDTINLAGGGFNNLDGGAGANNVLNVNASDEVPFGTTIANIQTVNVNSPATLTNNAVINAGSIDQLNIMVGATLINNAALTTDVGILNDGTLNANAAVTTNVLTNNGALSLANNILVTANGAVTNTGSIIVSGGGVLQANTTYTQNAGASFVPLIDSTTSFGLINVTGGATLQANSLITPEFTSGNFIPAGTNFDVLTAGGGIVDNGFILGDPSSATLFFTSSFPNANTLRLTSGRIPYQDLVQSPIALGIAPALDVLAQPPGPTDSTLLSLLGQLDTLTTGAELNDALISLAPTVNYALVQGTHVSMDNAFNSVLFRIEKMRNLKPLGAENYVIHRPEQPFNGANYGDGVEGITGVWVKVYGAFLDQRFYQNLDGYLGDSVGYAIGADWGTPEMGTVGLAISYTNTHTVGNSEEANVLNIQSVQGTAYAWYEPMESVFVDAMFGFSSNKYDSRRNIGIGTFTTSAFAKFYGVQYGAQSDVGYAFTYDNLIVAPVSRVKYTHLQIDNYTETGAGGASLSVTNTSLNELVGGVGIRVLGNISFAQAKYVPEGMLMILYDFYGDGQQTVSNFIGGGPLFPTDGPNPSHAIYLLELGISAYTYDNYSFYVKYDLEVRDRWHYYGNSAYMMLRGEWG